MARICTIRRFFCCDLQLGSYCVSLACMALSALTIWSYFEAIETIKTGQTQNKDDMLIRNNFTEEWTSETRENALFRLVKRFPYRPVVKVSYTGAGFCAVDVIMAVLLICGTCQLKVCMLWTWITWRFFMFVFLLGITAFFFVTWKKIPPIGIILLVNLVVAFACFIVVFSLTQEIKEMEDLKNEVTLDSPAVLLSNKNRLSSREHYF